MPRGGSSQGSLSQEFHDIMLGITTGTVNYGPPASQGPSSPQRSPTIQSTSSPQRPTSNAGSQPVAQPFRSSFSSSDKGVSAELKEKYAILQRGYITLETKYKRRHEDLVKLQEELRLQAEAHAKHTNELTERLGTKEGQAISTDEPTKQLEVKELELEKLRGEMKTLSHASKTVKGIIAHALDEFVTQLTCPVCSKLLQVPHSFDCLHVACCACIIGSFNNHGAACPICWQPCTQPPKENAVIRGVLSITYKLRAMQEPTFASLGIDPDFFLRCFQSSEQRSDEHHDDQRRLEEAQRAAVPDDINQQVRGEGGGTSGSVVAADGGEGSLTTDGAATTELEDVEMAHGV